MEGDLIKTIPVILGPTCMGKTSLALELCRQRTGEIISADSRQVCKYMDIGTGKLPEDPAVDIVRADTKWIVDGVNIWAYDLITPDKYFSVYDFAQFALSKMAELLANDQTIFLVGGTGFYIDVLTGKRRLVGTKPDLELRKSLETTPTKNLLIWLKSINPARVTTLDTKNRARIIRALEVELLREKECAAPLPFLADVAFKFIGLTAERDFLYVRTDAWFTRIWPHLLGEVQTLWNLGFKTSPKLNGLVYKEAVAYLKGDLAEEEAIQQAKFSLHAYVRRQQTYFKKNKDIHWFDVSQDSFPQNVYNEVSKGYVEQRESHTELA